MIKILPWLLQVIKKNGDLDTIVKWVGSITGFIKRGFFFRKDNQEYFARMGNINKYIINNKYHDRHNVSGFDQLDEKIDEILDIYSICSTKTAKKVLVVLLINFKNSAKIAFNIYWLVVKMLKLVMLYGSEWWAIVLTFKDFIVVKMPSSTWYAK